MDTPEQLVVRDASQRVHFDAQSNDGKLRCFDPSTGGILCQSVPMHTATDLQQILDNVPHTSIYRVDARRVRLNGNGKNRRLPSVALCSLRCAISFCATKTILPRFVVAIRARLVFLLFMSPVITTHCSR
jgi:hypothetical protein